MPAIPNVGDRVTVVRTGKYGLGDVIDGLTGTIVPNTRTFYPEAFAVKLDTPRPSYCPPTALVEVVAVLDETPQPVDNYDPPTAAVGDRVTVLRQPRAEKIVGNYEGKVGTVHAVSEPFRRGNQITHRYYDVCLDSGPIARATKVAPTPETPMTSARDNYFVSDAAPTKIASVSSHDHTHVDLDAVPIMIDVKRAQSLMAAKTVLGEYAEADDLLRLAEYVENATSVSDDPTVGVIKRAVDVAQKTPVDVADDLVFTDVDGDELRVGRAASEPGQAVCISTDTDYSGVYLSNDKVDEFVAFVLACRAQNS